MANAAIVQLSDLSIVSKYEGTADIKGYGGPWGDPDVCVHLAIPDALDADCVKAAMSQEKWTKEGEADVTTDPLDQTWTHVPSAPEIQADQALIDAKTQKDRDKKLSDMRDQRDGKLKSMDHMAIDVALGTRADGAAVATYKADLLAATDPYKDVNGDATSAIDALADDLSDMTWPTAP